MRTWTLIALVAAVGCGDKDTDGDTAAGGDTASDGSGVAPLADSSNGQCPDLSASGTTSTFSSADLDRTVTVYYPDDTDQELGVVFYFHGLLFLKPGEKGYDGNLTQEMGSGIGAQGLANEHGVVVVIPEAPVLEREVPVFGTLSAYLWNVEDGRHDTDLTLYDDLRTCVAEEFPSVDLDRVAAMGFSGGALFTSAVSMFRGDTLAAAAEMSGGADISLDDVQFLSFIAEADILTYQSPATKIPMLLTSGGEGDIWPDPSFAIFDFELASDGFEQHLVDDEHFVVRCRDENGHAATRDEVSFAIDWVTRHRFGEASPYQTEGIGDAPDGCEISGEGE